jgi:predicted dehydrogenase
MIADAHATAIQASGEAELVSVADPAPDARRAAQERWGCSAYESVEQMLREVEIDAACVCAPPALHRPLTEQLLHAGVHVLCEKPLAVSGQDAGAMVDLAEERQLTLAVSSKFRFVPDLSEACRLIQAGTIGQPISCGVTLCARIPIKHWNQRRDLAGGGVVMDNGPHAYDIVTVALGQSPIVTSAVFAPRVLSPEVEDTAEILFRTDGGAIGRIALSWTYFTKDLDYLVVQGRKGTLRIGWAGSGVRLHGKTDWTPFGSGYRKAEAFRSQLAAFLSTASNARPAAAPPEMTAALDFVERVYEAERFGRAGVSLDSWGPFSGVAPR